MKYAYIESLRGVYAIKKMCLWLGVSRSGYYKWRTRDVSNRAVQSEIVREAVKEVFEQFKHRYGAPRLTVELNERGYACSINHVAKLLSDEGLKARNGKGYRYFPPVQAINHVSQNRLARQFEANKPNVKWVSDITYIKLQKGFVYLAVIMDLFSRRIVGWALDTSMTHKLTIEALEMAVATRDVEPGMILHSDRGVQYRSGEYQYQLSKNKIQPSMSRKGNCWDNAVMESFFARLKVEAVHGARFTNKNEAYAAIFDYIELFYNNVRRHSAIDYMSPNEYENLYHESKQ